MSARLKRNFHILQLLQKANPKYRKAILKEAPSDLILCICEAIDNVLQGTVKLTPIQRKKLGRYKSMLRSLSVKRSGVKKKRELLVQKGGFLPAILAPIISVAGALLGEVLRK